MVTRDGYQTSREKRDARDGGSTLPQPIGQRPMQDNIRSMHGDEDRKIPTRRIVFIQPFSLSVCTTHIPVVPSNRTITFHPFVVFGFLRANFSRWRRFARISCSTSIREVRGVRSNHRFHEKRGTCSSVSWIAGDRSNEPKGRDPRLAYEDWEKEKQFKSGCTRGISPSNCALV